MAPAEAQVAPNNAERRRSERWPLALPLVVRGMSLDAKAFQEETFTLSVSAHGALLALSTTVTLGQTLFLRNPQTQDEAGVWVTRFGLPRGGFAQVGVEFVRPDADFWSNKAQAKPPADDAEVRADEGVYILPRPSDRDAIDTVSSDSGDAALMARAALPESVATATLASHDILLHALEKTLRQVAEQVVAEAAALRLGAAVNQAATAIENFSQARTRQLEERFQQQRQELTTTAREEFLSQIQADAAHTKEVLRKSAEVLIEGAARNAHSDLARRLSETANEAAAQFVENANISSAQHAARFADQIQVAAGYAHTQMEAIAAGLQESQSKAWGEMERAVTETRQRMESISVQMGETYADWETRLRALQKELAFSKEQEVDHFRERLRNILTTLLASLG